MRTILIWNNVINRYSIKVLNELEEQDYNTLIEYKNKAKELYKDVVKSAKAYNMPLDLFIDNEAYYQYQLQNHYCDIVYKLAEKFNIKFNIPRLCF